MATTPPPGIMSPMEGPFRDYLRPYQPRPIDQPRAPNTGYEGTGTALGNVALDFLQGVRQNRLAKTLEAEHQAQMGMDRYQTYINGLLRDPNLTDDAKQKIWQEANNTMAAHLQHQMKDVPKGGVMGALKNFFIEASGGPMQVSQPLDWNMEVGKIHGLTQGENTVDHWRQLANQQMAQAMSALGPDASPLQIKQAAAKVSRDLNLDSKLGPQGAMQWLAAQGYGYPGGMESLLDDAMRPTAPPPTARPPAAAEPFAATAAPEGEPFATGAPPVRSAQPVAQSRPAQAAPAQTAQATVPQSGATVADASGKKFKVVGPAPGQEQEQEF